MSSALIALAAEIGAPLVRDILAKKIGAGNARLATDVLGLVAEKVGIAPADLEARALSDPDLVKSAIAQVEAMTPEIVSLYTAGLEGQYALQKAEMSEPIWTWAWRPLGMYGFGFLWIWNIVLLHVANAFFKIALPQTDLWLLFQLNSVYMALYMGGHTFKDFVAAKWAAK